MPLLSRLLGTDDRPQPLWHAVVAEARDPRWYRAGGVADTTPGRFDMVVLVLALVLLRMERSPTLATAAARLTELFVTDMDGQLRESGVGDLAVGKHVGQLMGVLGGRLGAYRGALAEGGLAGAVARNVSLREGADPAAAQMARALAERLARLGDDALLAGRL